jgi:two-component system, response regulator
MGQSGSYRFLRTGRPAGTGRLPRSVSTAPKEGPISRRDFCLRASFSDNIPKPDVNNAIDVRRKPEAPCKISGGRGSRALSQDNTILLVEDSSDDERLTLRAIRKSDANVQIIVARDGEEALMLLFGRNGKGMIRPALVILDLKLPKIGGLDVLTRLRSEDSTKTLPVVVLSSSDEGKDIAESYRRGANSYVRKPVAFTEFVDAVHHLHQYWLNVNVRNGID